ncbi:Processing alpha glucosidase I [Rhizopus stolonifer]|uniref:Mannosyl-oligosaccharide glucosidase n=1 Tax=Rhizopus stolonifer TaxID=4846 RepID=A0A367KWV6_RHIST|nr:Processing alpha glucosidase I [Rhizopus stolonifer]
MTLEQGNRWAGSLAKVSALALMVSSVAADIMPGTASASNSSLLWGTYRPNLYFGTRPRLPESLMTGLMWFDANNFQGFQRIRHACDQNDGIAGYGYHKHDGREYASQEINDAPSNIKLSTEFIKVPGGKHGGDWGVRVSGTPLNGFGAGGIDIMSKMSKKGLESPIRLEGDTPDLGDFEIQIIDNPLNTYPQEGLDQDLKRTQWLGREVPEGQIWRAKDVVMENIVLGARGRLAHGTQEEAMQKPFKYFTLSNKLVEEEGQVANFYVFQKVLKGEFQFDVIFRSQSSNKPLTSESLSSGLIEKEKAFHDRFEKTFHLKEKGFSSDEVEFAQYLLSNMLGGIGYFHGSSVIDRSHPPMQDEESFKGEPARPEFSPPQTLFTATPSRSFFPRGFYWDEGFHQLLIGQWDNDLSLDIIKHWTSMIDENGWVAREQILGEEARSKVPAEFQTQFHHYANPPTLYLSIKRYIDRLEKHQQDRTLFDNQQVRMGTLDDTDMLTNLHLDHAELADGWLKSIYPKLRQNWLWFRNTQFGYIDRFGRKAPNKEAYRWRGRTLNHTLTSGLDDYPRGEPSVGELHLDLHSWMAFGTGLLRDIASKLGPEFAGDFEEYDRVQKDMLVNLDALHWNEEKNMYCDQSLQDNQPVFICHKGYLSLFPMILNLLPIDSPKLGAILDMIEDEKELWSPYGLRSLSASDEFFGTAENYWRGPIWLPINYLTLQSLYKNYMHVSGPYQARAQKIYSKLRDNIIRNVYRDYKETGYVWEQYSESTGQGLRSHPFTGWTSLVLLIMAEEY